MQIPYRPWLWSQYFTEYWTKRERTAVVLKGLKKLLRNPSNLARMFKSHSSESFSIILLVEPIFPIAMGSSAGQYGIPAAYIRGGTSKAVFLSKEHIPPPGPLRDAVLKRIMGSPDPMQIDGMGGTRVVTSKIAIVSPSEREDVDIDYEFAQVGIDQDDIGYDGNCGNISSAVGPYAIDEGMVKRFRIGASIDKTLISQEIRIWNTGTKKLIISHVPVDSRTGKSISNGTASIDGTPGTGAPILIDFRNVCLLHLGQTLGNYKLLTLF